MADALLERFLDVARRGADRVAIATRSHAVTYGELAASAGAVASRLASMLETSEQRVAILTENSPAYAAVVYGAWWAGHVAVGLNPMLEVEELDRLVMHARAGAVVIDRSHPRADALARRLGGGLRVVDALDLTTPVGAPSPPSGTVSRSEALAAIVYTSGTTGHPKGVMLSHRNLAANTSSIQASLPIRRDDRALCVLPFQYSYGASVLHTHLTLGAGILLENSLMYPHLVVQRIEESGATSLAGVPSTFYLLLDRTDLAAKGLDSLRYVTQAGGRMAPERIQAFMRAVPGADFFVMYGQTEASARLSCLPAGELRRKLGSAGRAIPGVELRIRGDDGADLSAGVLGEVYARGENVMSGYWEDPEETERVLAGGWLRTGDLGRLDEEGYLFLEARSREIIKSGAYRIAPAEVEEVIRLVPGVVDVAVVGVEHPILGEAIHAHVVVREAGRDMEMAVMRTCRERLARYKLPRAVHFRSELPRTASGKVQKHLL